MTKTFYFQGVTPEQAVGKSRKKPGPGRNQTKGAKKRGWDETRRPEEEGWYLWMMRWSCFYAGDPERKDHHDDSVDFSKPACRSRCRPLLWGFLFWVWVKLSDSNGS